MTIILNIQEIARKIRPLIENDIITQRVMRTLLFTDKAIDEIKKIRAKRGLNPKSVKYKNMIALYKEYENNIEGLRERFELVTHRKTIERNKKNRKKTMLEKKQEAEMVIRKLYEPNASTEELAMAYGVIGNTLDELRNNKIILKNQSDLDDLIKINLRIMSTGKRIILEKMQEMNIKNMADLKSLSDLIDTAFKQNRLLQGESTRNVAVGIKELYDRIVENADMGKNPQNRAVEER